MEGLDLNKRADLIDHMLQRVRMAENLRISYGVHLVEAYLQDKPLLAAEDIPVMPPDRTKAFHAAEGFSQTAQEVFNAYVAIA